MMTAAPSPSQNQNHHPHLMGGKSGLVMGVANNHSIAWHITRSLCAHGARVGLSYQSEMLKKRVVPLAQSVDATVVGECDVTDDAQVDGFFDTVSQTFPKLDFLVHAIAYADQAALQNAYINVDKDQFTKAMLASVYSFTAVVRAARPLLNKNASILTLTYLGSRRVVGAYGVMGVAKAGLEASVRYLAADLGDHGVRVNALSAGPMPTLAARVIGGATDIYKWQAANSPLERAITGQDVGNAAVYLLSDWSSGITATVHHVDAGYHSSAGLKA